MKYILALLKPKVMSWLGSVFFFRSGFINFQGTAGKSILIYQQPNIIHTHLCTQKNASSSSVPSTPPSSPPSAPSSTFFPFYCLLTKSIIFRCPSQLAPKMAYGFLQKFFATLMSILFSFLEQDNIFVRNHPIYIIY